MGLAERRAILEFQNNRFPELQEKINKTAGFELNLEIDWESLAEAEGYASYFEDSLPKIYFTPLMQALKQICTDELGRSALKKGLKKVVISNLTGNYYPDGFTFEYGVLKIDHEPCTNMDDVAQRTESIKKLLENGL